MNITLRFFASVREELGTSQETVVLPAETNTVGAVRAYLAARGGVWASALGPEKPLRMACNHTMCAPDMAIADGGEVAFFPPVTGG